MFDNLLESKPQKQRSLGGTIMSVVLHVGLILGAIQVTANAGQKDEEKEKVEEVKFVETPKDEPPPPEPEKAPPPPDVVAAPPPPKGFQILTAPIEIPDKLPEIDLSKTVTDEADFTGKGVAGGTSKGIVGGTPQPVQNTDQPYFEFQVEKPVLPKEGCKPPPKYPEVLRSAGVTGKVLVQFVVDQDGKPDMKTFKELESSHALFTSAARATLAQWCFYPAETGGRKVKQLVQLPFNFSIQ
jgi:periplasmic protein TonB